MDKHKGSKNCLTENGGVISSAVMAFLNCRSNLCYAISVNYETLGQNGICTFKQIIVQ